MTLTCSTSLLYWSYAEQLTCTLSLRPASRDQIRDRAVRQRSSVIRQRCQRHQQRTTRVTGFLPTSDPSVISSRLDLQKHHQDQARTWVSPYLEASRSIFSSQYVQNRQTLNKSDANLVFHGRHSHHASFSHPYRAAARRRSFGAPSGAQQT